MAGQGSRVVRAGPAVATAATAAAATATATGTGATRASVKGNQQSSSIRAHLAGVIGRVADGMLRAARTKVYSESVEIHCECIFFFYL